MQHAKLLHIQIQMQIQKIVFEVVLFYESEKSSKVTRVA